ncbi:MAG: DUF3794 domain-containing protein [Clostridiales bacterium]|jgi:hypothetical protein|nr:DUF3794 domain-containing protein [Clostridiales bacterium]
MADLKFGEIKNQYKKLITVSQVMVGFDVESRDGKKIKKVLSIAADPKVVSVDALNGEAVVSGRVNYKILYLNEDGEPVSLDYFSDYKDKISDGAILPASSLTVKTSVADITVNDGGGLSISLVLENAVYMIASDVIPVLKSVPENYFDERRRVVVQSYAAVPPVSAAVSGESPAGGEVGEILMLDVSAVLSDTTVGNGVAAYGGAVYADVLYTTRDGLYLNKQFTIPFSEEQAVPQGLAVSAFAEASVKSSKVVLSGTAEDNIIGLEAVVEIAAAVVADTEEEVVSDVFSVTHELNTAVEKVVKPRFYHSAVYSETVGGSVSLAENMPAADEVLGYFGARNNIASLTAGSERVNVEGVLNLTVLYRGGDGGINSADVEIPYSVDVKDTDISENFRLEGRGAAGTVSVRRKKDREIDVSAELFFCIQAYGDETISVVLDVEETAEKKEAASAVSIYNAGGGETLWDIAKSLSCTPETILNQNEELVFPVKNPGRVVLYRELEEI